MHGWGAAQHLPFPIDGLRTTRLAKIQSPKETGLIPSNTTC